MCKRTLSYSLEGLIHAEPSYRACSICVMSLVQWCHWFLGTKDSLFHVFLVMVIIFQGNSCYTLYQDILYDLMGWTQIESINYNPLVYYGP
jgi:hypothetical protein